ncbi:melanoma-associated antigen 8-like [Perognathus longimembris pacificus]|uniref:melanoma-associated antigen 8-like n=1 Tax=Perognathus longimembris pacificus TaxID=214514 RepID=UPI002019AA29|nr:melanoma-associated antigen 8-like [Perognathus longimembris pacificus]
MKGERGCLDESRHFGSIGTHSTPFPTSQHPSFQLREFGDAEASYEVAGGCREVPVRFPSLSTCPKSCLQSPGKVIMPHSEKNQQDNEGSPKAKRKAPESGLNGLVPKEEEAATATPSCSAFTTLMLATPREVPTFGIPCDPPSPPRPSSPPTALVSSVGPEFDQGSRSQGSEILFFQRNILGPLALLRYSISLVPFLLLRYQMRQPVSRAEILTHVVRCHRNLFPAIFNKTRECMKLVFGTDMIEINPAHRAYILVPAAGLRYDGLRSDVHGVPKTGLLIMVLCFIFRSGNRATEEVIWGALCKMGICVEKRHYIYGNIRRLIMEDFVRLQYLEYRQVPHANPIIYEFLWGPRARAETTKMKILHHWAKFSGNDPRSFPILYDEALREEHSRRRRRRR